MSAHNPNDNSGQAGYVLFYGLIAFILFIILCVAVYNRNFDALG